MFTTPAYAQTVGAGTDMQTLILNVAPFLLVGLVCYFLLFRPQQQKAKEIRQQQAALRRGDRIVTAGGVLGTIARVINDDEIEVQVAEGVKIRVVRSTISTVLAKTEPVASKEAKSSDSEAAAPDPDPDTNVKKRRTISK